MTTLGFGRKPAGQVFDLEDSRGARPEIQEGSDFQADGSDEAPDQ
jgi:hypothetical protein